MKAELQCQYGEDTSKREKESHFQKSTASSSAAAATQDDSAIASTAADASG